MKRVLKMEKLPEYHAEEDIEEWLEIFECHAACSKISNEKTKIQWCKSVIGGVGRRILEGLISPLIFPIFSFVLTQPLHWWQR